MFFIGKIDKFNSRISRCIIEGFFFLCFALIIMSFSKDAFCVEDNFDVIGNVLCRVYVLLTGRVAKAMSSIAIVFVSIGALFGKTSWGIVIIMMSCVACTLAAHKIVELIGQASGVPDYAFSCSFE